MHLIVCLCHEQRRRRCRFQTSCSHTRLQMVLVPRPDTHGPELSLMVLDALRAVEVQERIVNTDCVCSYKLRQDAVLGSTTAMPCMPRFVRQSASH